MKNHELFLEKESLTPVQNENQVLFEEIQQVKADIVYLKDLFIRRLSDDKQKNGLIQNLSDVASFAIIEPFLHDIILLLDRMEKSDDDFVASLSEELYDIIKRRGVEHIENISYFDPLLHKVVKAIDDPNASEIYISEVIRKGYQYSGKVLRATEVIVGRPSIAVE